MRKYQQLLLLLFSCFSLIILLIYKGENNRLKYVLQVVNFFGRNDSVVMQRFGGAFKDDQLNFAAPLPVWQAIGEAHHAYAAYWITHRSESDGEAMALVTGKLKAVVHFRCSVLFDEGTRNIEGKFRFQHMEYSDIKGDGTVRGEEFSLLYFYCYVKHEKGRAEKVIFTDLSSESKPTFRIFLRHVPQLNVRNPLLKPKAATVCVNLVNSANSANLNFIYNERRMLQFFFHHHLIGIDDFIVYGGEEIPWTTVQLLQRRSTIHVHFVPFNFPFDTNSTKGRERVRRLVEADCLMRNTHASKYTMLLEPNEFFYPNAKVGDVHSALQSLQHYSAEVTHFELPIFAVCVDEARKLLIDNSLYDPELHSSHSIYIYKPHIPGGAADDTAKHRVSLSVSTCLAHRYTTCLNVGSDGLHDWRNSLREDFMQSIRAYRQELDVLIV